MRHQHTPSVYRPNVPTVEAMRYEHATIGDMLRWVGRHVPIYDISSREEPPVAKQAFHYYPVTPDSPLPALWFATYKNDLKGAVAIFPGDYVILDPEGQFSARGSLDFNARYSWCPYG